MAVGWTVPVMLAAPRGRGEVAATLGAGEV